MRKKKAYIKYAFLGEVSELDWNWAPLPSVEAPSIWSFLSCTRCKVHVIPPLASSVHLSCPVPAISSEAGTKQSCFIFQTGDPKHSLSKKVTSFSASHHPAYTCTQKTQCTVLLHTEGLLCSVTWTNHFCRYPIQGRKLLLLLEFICKWLIIAICWKHTPSCLWKSSRVFWYSENNPMSCLRHAGKSRSF